MKHWIDGSIEYLKECLKNPDPDIRYLLITRALEEKLSNIGGPHVKEAHVKETEVDGLVEYISDTIKELEEPKRDPSNRKICSAIKKLEKLRNSF